MNTTDTTTVNEQELYGSDEIGEIIYDIELIADQRRAIVQEFRAYWAREFFVKDALPPVKDDRCSAGGSSMSLSAMYTRLAPGREHGHACPQCRESGIPAVLTEYRQCPNCRASASINAVVFIPLRPLLTPELKLRAALSSESQDRPHQELTVGKAGLPPPGAEAPGRVPKRELTISGLRSVTLSLLHIFTPALDL